MSEDPVIKYLQAFSAGSANDDTHTHLWAKGAGMIFDQLDRLLDILGHGAVEITSIEKFSSEHDKELGGVLTRHRSDKEFHRYHLLYAHILQRLGREEELNVLEVGLGTNNPSLVSSMGSEGRPGASLYAWSEYLPRANIYGADIDTDILFQDPLKRIRTGYVDQLETATLDALPTIFGKDRFDLIIDDGLHSFAANMNTLLMGLKYLKPKGWIVVEDIQKNRVNSWRLVKSMFQKKSDEYETFLIRSVHAFLFVVHLK